MEPSSLTTSISSPGFIFFKLNKTPGPWAESKWPVITAGPMSPGMVPKLYQPVCSGEPGTCKAPPVSRPVLTIGALSFIAGTLSITGSGLMGLSELVLAARACGIKAVTAGWEETVSDFGSGACDDSKTSWSNNQLLKINKAVKAVRA